MNEKMLEIADDFNLTQMVREPTRQGNILNLVFTTHSDLVNGTFVVPGMSHHSAVKCDINLRTLRPINPPRPVYLYKKANMTGLQEHLREAFSSFQAAEPILKTVENYRYLNFWIK